MKKYTYYILIIFFILLVILFGYLLKVDYLIEHPKFMLNSLYCEKDTDCDYISTGCGGCAYKLSNKYSGEQRFDKLLSLFNIYSFCSYTTDCYWGRSVTACKNNLCKGYSIEDCYQECEEDKLSSAVIKVSNNGMVQKNMTRMLEIYRFCTEYCKNKIVVY